MHNEWNELQLKCTQNHYRSTNSANINVYKAEIVARKHTRNKGVEHSVYASTRGQTFPLRRTQNRTVMLLVLLLSLLCPRKVGCKYSICISRLLVGVVRIVAAVIITTVVWNNVQNYGN